MMNKIYTLLLIAICCSCSQSHTDKHHGKRNKIVNVHDKVKEIVIEDVLVSDLCGVSLIDKYLIISDHKSSDDQIHLFDKNTFTHIASIAPKGQGPGEIANMGYLAMDEAHQRFFVTDHGKNKIYSYPLDSVLANRYYQPEAKMSIGERECPGNYIYLSDTLCIGDFMKFIESYGIVHTTAKWDMITGRMTPFENLHPELKRPVTSIELSVEHGIFVECYHYHDLMVIRSLDGGLKYNIYGQKWDTETSNKKSYFGQVVFCKDKIIAEYEDGNDTFFLDKHGAPSANWATRLIVFDLQGNYINTLEVGYELVHICYDEQTNRLIFGARDDIEFGYLDLEGVID